MRKLYLCLLALCANFMVTGQTIIKTSPANNEVKLCGQSDALLRMQIENPARYQQYLQARSETETETFPSLEKSGVIYTIPVVFHILHNNGSENISDAQIQDALTILNRDYRKQNADVNNVVAQFLSIAGDVEIEFALAKVAPNGACFNGITRTVTTLTNNGSSGQSQVNAVVSGNNVYAGIWPHNKYLNVYVCNDLGNAAGYTFLPASDAGATAQQNMYYNGIFMLHNYTGSIGTSNVIRSRALTHEVGHWLNLKHTWGDGNTPGAGANCSDDDGVNDTPNTVGSNGVCDLGENTCGPLANVENYMEYSYCSKMFTNGQVTRMRNAITSSTAGRNNIWTTANLQAVGVLPGSSACSATIEATQTGVCAGTSTTFSVTNMTAPITAYSWTFQGGTPGTSTAATPTVTYNTAGTYNVSVVITTASGNTTLTRTGYITVSPSVTPVSLPITEGFVSTTFPPANWTIDNGGVANTWVRNTNGGTAPTTGNSARIDYSSSNNPGEIDDLNTPAFSLSGYTSSTLKFDVAYRPYTGYSDKLEVLVSPGCGMAYEVVYSKAGTTLMTEAAPNQSAYTSPTTWRAETVNLTPYVGNGQVKVKFRGTNGYSNFVYIDNVNITGVASGPNASFTPSTTTGCVGQSVTYTNTSTQATSWSWNFGTGATPSTATGAGPHTVTYSSGGSKTVTLTINGGASTTTQTVTVNTVPSAPTVNVADNCGNSVLTATGGSGYSWSTGSTASSVTVTTSNTVTVTQSNQGCISPATTVAPNPKPLPTVSMGTLPTVCVYHNAITLNQGTPAGGTYSGQGVSGTTFTPTTAGTGTKTITYSYTAANGCTNTATGQLLVDGCLSVEVENELLFNVFPNPSNGEVNVKSSSVIQEITVLDNAGRVVNVFPGNQVTEMKLDLKHLSAGSYHIQSRMDESTRIVKLIIQ